MTADRNSKTLSIRHSKTPSGQRSAPTTPRPPLTPGTLSLSPSGKPKWPQVVTPEPAKPDKPSLWRRFRSVCGHFTIMILLASYTAAGGVCFRLLEHPKEMEDDATVRELFNVTRTQVLEELLQLVLTQPENNLTREDVLANISSQMESFQDLILLATDEGVDITADAADWKWKFGSSLFFAATVVTTIGYGNIAPLTAWGRIFCIVFALFGIPLTLIAIGDMGKLFAVALKKIGRQLKRLRPQKTFKVKKSADDSKKNDDDDDEDDSSGAGHSTVLKVLGAIFLLLVYIAIGAVIFMLWEEWAFLDSFYFCFITMTTIGLGDIVPHHQMFMLLCTVYILVGLAVTSTCIELARAEYEKSWKRMLDASRRLHNLSILDNLKKLNEQIEMHGQIVDMSVLDDLKDAIKASQEMEDSTVANSESDTPQTPPVYVIYETSV